MLRNIHSESPRNAYRFLSSLLISLMIVGVGPQAVWAAPQGAQVVAGQVQLSQQGSVTTIHASNNSIINYQSFNIAKPETVQFVQPDAAARVLNRIQGIDPTHINGSLLANGRVYIVNPAGVYFGKDAVVNVGALVAAAGSISNQDFKNGLDHFTGVKGQVINLGSIKGDIVALLGKEVANRGTITSHDGLIALVAGNDVVLVPTGGHLRVHISSASGEAPPAGSYGVENSGTLDAGKGEVNLAAGDVYSLAIRQMPGGLIKAHDIALNGGANGDVQVSGTLDASDTSPGAKGGNIAVLGDKVTLAGAQLDASGDAGGGSVLVGGDVHGGGGAQAASTTSVSSDSSIHADAITKGDGGRAVVWSEKGTTFSGQISARGGSQGGNGGFAEVSGKAWLAYQGLTDLTATNGLMGTLLLDPTDITIEASGTDPITGSDISASTVVSALNGANVLLQATNDITVNQTIDSSANAMAGDLDLEAGHSIFLNAGISLNGSFTASNSLSTAGATNFGGSPVDTTGSQTYNGPAQISSDTTLTSNGNKAITFNDTVDGPAGLTISTGGDTTFAGPVGGATPLANLLTNSGGQTIFSGGGVTTTSFQTYFDDVLLGADTALTSTGVGAISLNGALNGPFTFAATTKGDVTFGQSVGGITPIGDLTLQAGHSNILSAGIASMGNLTITSDILNTSGATVLGGGTISTGGAQIFNGPTQIAADTTLTSSGSGANGAIDFNGAVDGPGGMSVSTAGDTTFAQPVGTMTALGHLTLQAGRSIFLDGDVNLSGNLSVTSNSLNLSGTTLLGGSSVASTGSQTFSGPTQIAGGLLTLTSGGSAPITFNGRVDGPGQLRVNAAGAASFLGGGTQVPLADLVVNGGGGIVLAGGPLATVGFQTYVSAATLSGDTALQSTLGGVTFMSTVDGPGGLTVDAAGSVTFDGAVGGSPGGELAYLTTIGGQTVLNGLSVTTNDSQGYDDLVLGAGPTSLTSRNGKAITFGGSVNGPFGLLVDTTGDTTFNGNVGPNLGSLTTDIGGRTIFGTAVANVTTTGAQAYGDDVELHHANGTVTFQSLFGGAIHFQGTVAGPGGLHVATAGDTTFEQDLGASPLVPLLSLTTDGGGSTIFGGGAANAIDVTTTGHQLYDDALQLKAGTSVTSTNGGEIRFNGAVGGAQSLAVNTGGNTIFNGIVGGTPLASLQTDAGGTTMLNGSSITTMGAQTYGDALVVGAGALLSSNGGAIRFGSTVDGAGGLSVDTPGGYVYFGGDVGGNVLPAFVTVNVGTGPNGRIEFGSPATTQTVKAWGTIALNPGGRAAAPSLVATIFRRSGPPPAPLAQPVPRNLTIRSLAGSVDVGRNELFTVIGNLDLQASGNVMTGALTALNVTISGNQFLIEPQTSGPTSIIGNTIQVNAAPGTNPPGQNNKVQFATQTGGVHPDISTNVVTANPAFLVRAIYADGKSALQPAALLQGTTVVTVTPGGPAPGTLNSNVAAPAPVLPQTPFGGVNQVAVSERPLRASEVSAFLECDPHDTFCQDQAVGSVRANSAEAKKLRNSFDAVFGKVTPKQNPRREELQKAVDAYHKQFGKGPIGGVEFRQFLESNKEYASALDVLNNLGALFVNARQFGMTGRGLGDFEQRTLQDIAPTGMEMDQLEKAIEAGKLQQGRSTAGRQIPGARAGATG